MALPRKTRKAASNARKRKERYYCTYFPTTTAREKKSFTYTYACSYIHVYTWKRKGPYMCIYSYRYMLYGQRWESRYFLKKYALVPGSAVLPFFLWIFFFLFFFQLFFYSRLHWSSSKGIIFQRKTDCCARKLNYTDEELILFRDASLSSLLFNDFIYCTSRFSFLLKILN